MKGTIHLLLASFLAGSMAHGGIYSGGFSYEESPSHRSIGLMDLEYKSDHLIGYGISLATIHFRDGRETPIQIDAPSLGERYNGRLSGASFSILSPMLNFYPIVLRSEREYLSVYAGSKLSWEFERLYDLSETTNGAGSFPEKEDPRSTNSNKEVFLLDLYSYVGFDVSPTRNLTLHARYGMDYVSFSGDIQGTPHSLVHLPNAAIEKWAAGITVGFGPLSNHCVGGSRMRSLGYLPTKEDLRYAAWKASVKEAYTSGNARQLEGIATNREAPLQIRNLALASLASLGTDSAIASLEAIATSEPGSPLGTSAARLLASESLHTGLGALSRIAGTIAIPAQIREMAIERIGEFQSDSANLLLEGIALNERDSAIQSLALRNLSSDASRYRLAMESRSSPIRQSALRGISNEDVLLQCYSRVQSTTERQLIEDLLRTQESKVEILLRQGDWKRRRQLFQELAPDGLALLSRRSDDSALRIAADVLAGRSSWDQEFLRSKTGDVLGAVALVDRNKPNPRTVVLACHQFIMEGDSSRIPELESLLESYGDLKLAEDYMNCGHPRLEGAGRAWGIRRGYDVRSGSDGSHRVRWGRKR
ncbi:MAG TPA: hypothetical protein PKO15_04620 [Fibrobacteria bacterium]|nr:hypothetical protein [Fibrobacteria bacterium]HOX51241.1 hypothetical protein [Fibrobacteria bacterium]